MQISSCLPIRSSAKLRPQLEQAIKSSRGLGTNRDGGPLAYKMSLTTMARDPTAKKHFEQNQTFQEAKSHDTPHSE